MYILGIRDKINIIGQIYIYFYTLGTGQRLVTRQGYDYNIYQPFLNTIRIGRHHFTNRKDKSNKCSTAHRGYRRRY